MTCTPVKIGGAVAIVCSRPRRRRFIQCKRCGHDAQFVCDKDIGNGKTCDEAMCAGCAVEVGDDKHYCHKHAAADDIRPRQPDLFESVRPRRNPRQMA